LLKTIHFCSINVSSYLEYDSNIVGVKTIPFYLFIEKYSRYRCCGIDYEE